MKYFPNHHSSTIRSHLAAFYADLVKMVIKLVLIEFRLMALARAHMSNYFADFANRSRKV